MVIIHIINYFCGNLVTITRFRLPFETHQRPILCSRDNAATIILGVNEISFTIPGAGMRNILLIRRFAPSICHNLISPSLEPLAAMS